ncbi:hypothetical protein XENTR_v10018578 [Xenopus tropicalis]|nr:hypothetical protein XENTR_v10018578 [Xenopus tropicalis]
MAAFLRVQGVFIMPYLDNLQGIGRTQCIADSPEPPDVRMVHQPGQVVPVSQPEHDISGPTVPDGAPREKQLKIQRSVRLLRTTAHPTIQMCTRVLGLIVSTMEAVPFAQFCLQPLQTAVLKLWNRISLYQKITLPENTLRSLSRWLTPEQLTQGKTFLEPVWLIVTTDVSLNKWGATFQGRAAQGFWTQEEARLPINILELRAILLALHSWEHLLRNQVVRIQSDNATAVAYINRQGSTRSNKANQEVTLILEWAERTTTQLSAIHIPGVSNVEADFPTRHHLDPGEWQLHQDAFLCLTGKWGVPEINLMASRHNRRVPRFYARYRNPLAE